MAPSLVYSEAAHNGTPTTTKAAAAQQTPDLASDELHTKALSFFRCFVADMCQQFGGGHPGGAMGMAAIGIALWRYVMEYSPKNPDYFNRDRFVLSNGHTCVFQYLLMHLVGYDSMSREQLLTYHSKREDSLCPGHPEIEHSGVEVTTGPLGQGVANAVGLAMATKQLGATYNKPGLEVVNNHTWCMVGDACLQEGVALEAFQLAGHWRLNNLTVMFDNNNITCDGSADVAVSEDINAKMRACGWHVIDVHDGSFNVKGIVEALLEAKRSSLPTFINIRTIIGVGSGVANDAKAHGAAIGVDYIAEMKKSWGLNPGEHFILPDDVLDFYRQVSTKGKQHEAQWSQRLQDYEKEYPDAAREFKLRVKGEMVEDWRSLILEKSALPTSPTASRKSSGLVIAPLAERLNNLMIGTADLSPSVNLMYKNKVDFQDPNAKIACGLTGNYSGRYIHYGIREHAMCSISNGLSAFNRGTFLPVTSSFFMFYIYAAPGVRMAALQHLQSIHIATHDSIGTGEDGPTHQPIELASLYRAMPNLLYLRPCDSEEVAGAYIAAIEAKHSPSIISLSRQSLEQYPQHSSRQGVQRGGYVFIEEPQADVTLIGVGAEMVFAVQTRSALAERGIKARVVSFPCQRLFERQPREYRQQVLGSKTKAPVVVVEAYSPTGWERYADAGFSMGSFGKSLPGATAYEYFNFKASTIADKVQSLVDEVRQEGIEVLRGDFRDLNGGLV